MTQTSSLSTFRPSNFTDIAPPPGQAPDYDLIRETVDSIVPFTAHVGLRVTEVGPDGATVENPDVEHMHNQMGTVHAGVLFLLGEVACAAAFCGALAPVLGGVKLFVLRDGRTQYLKPALGRIRAYGTVEDRVTRSVLAGDTRGKFDMDGKAVLRDESGVVVAKMSFDYVCQVD
jgi:acyl-coenzyme A thioesterase PaaI-like protein